MKIGPAHRFHNEWFLLLSPAFLVIRGFARFSASVHWYDALWLFFEYGFWSVVITLVLSFFLSFRKAALFSCALIFFNVVYSVFYEYTEKLTDRSFFVRVSFIFPLVLLVFTILFFYLKRSKRAFGDLSRFLNLLFFVLIVTELFQFCWHLNERENALVKTTLCSKCETPDVHLVIADGYPGKKQLSEQFGFDNSAFEDSLRQFGFYLVPNSISNYSTTNFSMASILKMDYIRPQFNTDIHAPFSRTSVTDFFKKQGYKIVNNSVFNLDEQFTDRPNHVFKTGNVLLTNHSFISHVVYIIRNLLAGAGYSPEIERVKRLERNLNNYERDHTAATMQKLVETVQSKDGNPKFIYTHFLMPHGPYWFDENGQIMKDTGTEVSRHTSYLKYTNKQLLFAVRSVLQQSKKPPIILLLSDHGSRIEDKTARKQLRFYNLAAVYLPGRAYAPYYNGLSNVNQFRVLLNNHFGQHLPLLTDSTVY